MTSPSDGCAHSAFPSRATAPPPPSPSMDSSASLGSRVYVPLAVAWLEQLTFRFSALRLKRDVRYVLSVEHPPSGRRWAVAYSFDDCREFQRQLARALCLYFPKPRLFHSATSEHLIQKRCEALEAYIKTLQNVLLSRASHSCRVLTGRVAEALLNFVCGGDSQQFLIKQWAFAGQQQRARGSVHSLTSPSEDTDESVTSSERSMASFTSCCSLMSASSFVETSSTTTSEGDAEAPGSTTAKTTCILCEESMQAADGQYYYTTPLHCGHRFHDECLIPQLNIRMSCPTCHQPVTNDV